LALNIVLLFLLLSYILFTIKYLVNFERSRRAIRLMKESTKVSSQIELWLKNNLKEGCRVSVLSDPELVALFQKDQELYDIIIKLDPEWGNTQMPPAEMHKYFIELARGQHKQTH